MWKILSHGIKVFLDNAIDDCHEPVQWHRARSGLLQRKLSYASCRANADQRSPEHESLTSCEKFYVTTGASGADKSTLLNALGERGISVMPEAVLSIVQEQKSSDETCLPGTDPQALMNAVMERNIRACEAAKSLLPPVFLGRGMPERTVYMKRLSLDRNPAYVEASQARCYANTVLVAESWPEIHVCDQWRRALFARVARSFEPTVLAYVDEGYTTCVLPKVSVERRVAFILAHMCRLRAGEAV